MAVRAPAIETVTPVAASPAAPRPTAATPVPRRGSGLALALAGAWAIPFIAALALGRAGIWAPDWAAWGELTPAPLNRLLNGWIGPQLLTLNGLLGAAFLLAAAGLAALRSRPLAGILGRGGLIHAAWLIDYALFPALAVAAYCWTRFRSDALAAELDLLGQSVILSLPTLISAALYALALLAVRPAAPAGPLARPGRGLLLAWTIGALLYVDKGAGAAWPAALGWLRDAGISLGLWAWLLGYLLMIVRAAAAHAGDVADAGRGRRILHALPVAARAALHLTLLAAPVAMGVWLTAFARLDNATIITDRDGEVLQYRYPAGVFRLTLSAAAMPWALYQAVDAVEDAGIYTSPATHAPVSLAALGRNLGAASLQAGGGATFTGGSGVAAQVCKNFFGRPPVELAARFVDGYPVAAATAAYKFFVEFPCAWVYERAALLAPPERRPVVMWLNQVAFGRGAYGVEAASLSYFDKPARDLTPAEALFVVSRAQAPYAHDPAINPRSAARRTADAVSLMARRGFLSEDEADAILADPPAPLAASPYFPPATNDVFVESVAEELAALGYRNLSRGGYIVKTTLDSRLQAAGEAAVAGGLAQLAGRDASAASLLAIRPGSGEIVTMAPARGADGLNMAETPRQPGSAIKPLVYLVAFEQGWTPATVVWDLPLALPTPQGVYEPVNYDGQFRGPVSVRAALANSYNAPAVRALEFVGIPAFLARGRDFGLTSLREPADYGPALALGAAEVSLVELTGAYAALANGGVLAAPHTVLHVRDHSGRLLYSAADRAHRVARASDAFLITDILADNAARTPAFGEDSALRLDRPAAAKTGTTNDYRDSWTAGYTPELAAAVWVGNPDHTAMAAVAGLAGAAPVWREYMTAALAGTPPAEFTRPDDVVAAEVCADSGAAPEACPVRRAEWIRRDGPPANPAADWWQLCPDGGLALRPERVDEPAGQAWLATWAAANGVAAGCGG